MSELSEALERQLRKLMAPAAKAPKVPNKVNLTQQKSISLGFQEGSSDKVYHVQIVNVNGGFEVHFQYGRRGKKLIEGKKTSGQVSWADAKAIYSDIVGEKKDKGYKEI